MPHKHFAENVTAESHLCINKAEQRSVVFNSSKRKTQLYPVGLLAQLLNFIAPDWFVVRHKEQHGK